MKILMIIMLLFTIHLSCYGGIRWQDGVLQYDYDEETEYRKLFDVENNEVWVTTCEVGMGRSDGCTRYGGYLPGKWIVKIYDKITGKLKRVYK